MTALNEHPEQNVPGVMFGVNRPLTVSEMTQIRAFGPLPDTEAGVAALELRALVQQRLAEYDLETIELAPGFGPVLDDDTDSSEVVEGVITEITPSRDFSRFYDYCRDFE